MKKISLFLLLVVTSSCGNQTRIEKLANEADVVKVFVYGNGTVPVVHYETNDIDKIKGWKAYISNRDAEAGSCDFEGRLVFKVYEDSTEMKFSLKPGCTYVHFTAGDSTFNKELTAEGIAFIKGLMKVQ